MNVVHARCVNQNHCGGGSAQHQHQHQHQYHNPVPPPSPSPPPPPLLTGFSGGLPKNMDLHSQRKRPGGNSHSLFNSAVWRLSTQSSFSSSSSFSSPSSSTTSATTTSTTTYQPYSYLPEGVEHEEEEDNLALESENSYPAPVDNDNDNDNDQEEEEEEDENEDENDFVDQYNYRYKHIFSDSAPPPTSTASTSATANSFLELSFNIMTGPDRTPNSSSSHRANPLIPSNQPPRPPNAWILYRSDKLKNIPSPPPGAPKRPQAEVSKMISQMWKLESADVRAHYERLSEIKKAEHQATYPGYRFQPMKKEDKDRLRAEKQAEKEKEREARKANRRTRGAVSNTPLSTSEMPPLFTTEARLLPSSGAGSTGNSNTPISDAALSSATAIASSSSSSCPPGDLPTPPEDNTGSTPLPPPSSSSTITTPAPPLVAPRPTSLPQRPPSPSAWEEEQPIAGPSSFHPPYPQLQPQLLQQQPDTSFSFDNIPTWFDSSLFLPDPPSNADSYITVPLPSQQPLGWSPDDPGPLSDMHLSFFHPPSSSSSLSSHPSLSIQTSTLPALHHPQSTQPSLHLPPPPTTATATATATTISPDQLQLHAVLEATSDPNIFALDLDFANNELFDGTREIQVSMAPGPSAMLSAFHNLGMGFHSGTAHANEDLSSFLNWDASNFSVDSNHFTPSYSAAAESMAYSLPLGLDLGIDMDMDGAMDSFNTSSGDGGGGNEMSSSMGTSSLSPSSSTSMSVGLSLSMMSATPSMTSANTSQTSLNPTPPPLSSLSSEAGNRPETEEKEGSGRTVSCSKPNSRSSSGLSPPPSSVSTPTPYIPPAGAIHASTRRVAADWRHIRAMTPDPELDHPVRPSNSNNTNSSPSSGRDTTSVQA